MLANWSQNMMQATLDGKNRYHYEDNKMVSNIRGLYMHMSRQGEKPLEIWALSLLTDRVLVIESLWMLPMMEK